MVPKDPPSQRCGYSERRMQFQQLKHRHRDRDHDSERSPRCPCRERDETRQQKNDSGNQSWMERRLRRLSHELTSAKRGCRSADGKGEHENDD